MRCIGGTGAIRMYRGVMSSGVSTRGQGGGAGRWRGAVARGGIAFATDHERELEFELGLELG